MTESDPYRPIPCDLHSRYERAAMQGRRVALEWTGEQGRVRRERGKILDVQAHKGAEYLVFEDAEGGRSQVCLDQILGCDFGSP